MLADLLLLHLLHLDGQFALLFLFSTESLFLFTVFLGVFAIDSVFLLLNFTLALLLSLLLFEHTDELFAGNLDAFEALPGGAFVLRHALEVSAEQVIRLLAVAAVDKITRVLALETVLGILFA